MPLESSATPTPAALPPKTNGGPRAGSKQPPTQLVGAWPWIVRPPQSPTFRTAWSLVITIGLLGVPAALILAPRATTRTDSNGPVGILRAFTTAPGRMVRTAGGCTTTRPSMNVSHPPGQV